MASPTKWLRANAQHYLLRDAQARVARAHGVAPPPIRGSLFWSRIFVPVYRLLPWSLRRTVMTAMPGSHRKQWPRPTRPEGPAV
ncbi:hypothetical protein SAMN05421812_101508 [Asanoa hainanensis]|uniref:Uncharacterized protein n=1 Tax=Asanoa hainanensis TaxID=560556 RepID=A0A239GP86_9ACTN|nr:hypothetical protein [Asanoa hainanensis]SNS71066.1 hypothetical protein SAMN05421812_101508 [Asanoa hainanensis]